MLPLAKDYSRISLSEFSQNTFTGRGKKLADCTQEELLIAFHQYFRWSNTAIRMLEDAYNFMRTCDEVLRR